MTFLNCVIDKLDKKLFWPSNKINLFYETKDQNINFLNFSEDKKNLMYIFENDKVKVKLFKGNKKAKNFLGFNRYFNLFYGRFLQNVSYIYTNRSIVIQNYV